MAATVRAGGHSRRLEELCRIKTERLDAVIVARPSGFALKSRSEFPPRSGGVYAFWWTGAFNVLRQRQKTLILKGPGGRDVVLDLDDDWLGIEAGNPVPVYVGKTADNIFSRLGKHLLLGKPKKVVQQGRRKTTGPTASCQLRAGIERLFPRFQAPIDLIRENIGMSYVVLHGDDQAANRFYLEDLAIGWMRPVLNVDVER